MFNYLLSYKRQSRSARLSIFTFFTLFLTFQAVFGLDGNVDTAFTANAMLPSAPEAIAVQPDGKILIGGAFSAVNGVARPALARLNTDGTVDTSFNPPSLTATAVGIIYGIAVQPDGKILIGGFFRVKVNGQDRNGINRLNADGSFDTTFNTAVEPVASSNTVWAVAVQPDGKILMGGDFDRVYDVPRENFARLNADGSLDTFNPIVTGDDNQTVFRIVLQSNGQIMIGGSFTAIGGVPRQRIARINGDGTLDNSFGAGLTSGGLVGSIAFQTSGKIIIAGAFSQVNGVSKNRIARLNSDGSLDTSFTASITNVNGLAKARVQPDDKILLTGNIVNVNGIVKNNLARLNADGTLDNTFTAFADNLTVESLPADNPVVIGGFTKVNDTTRIGVARLLANGVLDTGFNASTGVRGDVKKLLPQPDGKTLIAGTFTHFETFLRKDIARVNADGTLDLTFNPGSGAGTSSSARVNDIALSSDSKIAVGGNFSTWDGASRRIIVVLNSNGSTDISFNPNFTQSGEIRKVLFYPGNKILILGGFRFGAETQVINLALLNADGSRDASFMPTFSGGNLNSIAVQPDGKIMVGGSFTTVNGVARNYIVRLNSDGSTDTSFNLNTPGYTPSLVEDVIVQPDGKLLLAGFFTRASGGSSTLIRVSASGAQDAGFNLPLTKEITSLFALQSDGRILGCLNYRPPNGGNVSHRLLIRLKTNGSIDYSFDLNSTGIGIAYLINTIAVQLDNKVLAGGDFTSYNGVPRLGTVRLENSLTPAPTIFDFEGDGKADISIFRPSVGEWWYLKSSNGGNAAFQFGNSNDRMAPADFTGDGKTDVTIFRPSTGEWFVLRSEDNSYYSFPFGTSGDIPAPGDFDGDGKADPTIFRPSTTVWYSLRSTGGTNIQQFGANGDVPVVGDYDGDGRSDIAIYRPPLGEWWIQRSASVSNSVIAYQFGSPGDKPVVGDYTGDGRADVAFYRPSNGFWFVLRSEDLSYYSFPFGTAGDIPAAADFDGDNATDAAVFRPSSSTWFIQRSTAGTLIQTFGIPGDTPVPSAFVP